MSVKTQYRAGLLLLIASLSGLLLSDLACAAGSSFVSRVQLTACEALLDRLKDPHLKNQAQREVDAAVIFSMIEPGKLEQINVPFGPLISLKTCGKAIAKATCAEETQELLNTALSKLAKEPDFISVTKSKATMGCAISGAIVGFVAKRKLGSAIAYGTSAAAACAVADAIWKPINCAKRKRQIYALTDTLPWPQRFASPQDVFTKGFLLISDASLSPVQQERLNDEFAVRVMLVEGAAKR